MYKDKIKRAEMKRIERFRAKYRGKTFYFPGPIRFDRERFKSLRGYNQC